MDGAGVVGIDGFGTGIDGSRLSAAVVVAGNGIVSNGADGMYS